MEEVLVVRTGTANLASVEAGLRRLGAEVRFTRDPAAVAEARRLVLPGVGAFAPAMQALIEAGLVEPLRERLRAGRPTLSICLGLQLWCEGSEEAPEVPGLGVLPGVVRRFPSTVRVPQLGWNAIEVDGAARCLESGPVVFANSYRLQEAPAGWAVARADHAGPFVAAVERGAVLGCQFHPELSGALGRRILERWMQSAKEEAPC